jgi:hypothetical protein
MILNRTYPATPITLNRKQLLEMNILLLQAFFPQEFTDKEREILLQYLLCLDESLSIHDKEVKLRVTEKCKLKSTASLNVYNERLRDKQAFIIKGKEWIVNPLLYVPKETTKYNLKVECHLEKQSLQH